MCVRACACVCMCLCVCECVCVCVLGELLAVMWSSQEGGWISKRSADFKSEVMEGRVYRWR